MLRFSQRRKCRNAAILESFLALFILLLVVFGLLQLYRLVISGMVLEYATFRGARSATVGFTDYLSRREALVKVIPASGAMVEPSEMRTGGKALFNLEKRHVERFMTGERYMEYEYWNGNKVRHSNYKCKYYGEEMLGGGCSVCAVSNGDNPHIGTKSTINGDIVQFGMEFKDFPLTMPLHEIYSKTGTMNFSRETNLTNHAQVFLEE